MSLQFNYLSAILLVAGSVILIIALLIFHRLDSRIKPFFYIMIATAIWSLGYGIELSSSTLEQMLFCTYLEYIGIALFPGLWTVFIIKFIGKPNWLSPINKILIFLIPVLTLVFVYTNQWHHLHYTSIQIDNTGPIPLLAISKGPWYVIYTFYFYTMLAWGIYLLLAKFKSADSIYKKQRNIILIATIVPWVFNVVYQVGLRPYKHLDPTPFMFIVTSLVTSYGFFRYKLFDVVPIAREKIIEEMQEGVLVLNRQNRVIDINPEMHRIISTGKNVIGEDYRNLFQGIADLNESQLITKNVFETTISHIGNERVYSVSVSPLFEQEVYTGTILLFKDITEIYAKEAMKALMQKKDDFLSIASHELKTPVTTLKGCLQIIEKIAQTENNASYLKFITQAERQVNKLTSLINDLLDVSKIESGKIQYNFADFEVAEIIDECVGFVYSNYPGHQIIVEGSVNLWVKADKNRIEQVLCNLLSNAIKYSPNSNQVWVRVSSLNDQCLIVVKDEGIGVPKELQQNLFQKFYRVENSNNKFSGLGLGLYISKEIVERHGGKLWVESEENKGSSFSLTIPLVL